MKEEIKVFRTPFYAQTVPIKEIYKDSGTNFYDKDELMVAKIEEMDGLYLASVAFSKLGESRTDKKCFIYKEDAVSYIELHGFELDHLKEKKWED